ncbi:hypothetical protein [Nostoc sp. TCL26-01]|uniref:hypothetical protein n=1 Tax=Nostoc sp. TCL26-01 TaxID=2576904 RepID=UPI0015BD69E6|nr:hypothetical protein [Nostoc sp. TCL26-01]QLE55545.1 hypothetical protein FD725_08465 [Nostoc sp. TCL26-01]
MKSSVYRNAAATACVLGLLVLLAGCWEMTVSFEAANPETSSQSSHDLPQLKDNRTSTVSSNNSNYTENKNLNNTSINSIQQKQAQTNSILATRQQLAEGGKLQGNLRMSNQTDQPVRLALLARQSVKKGSNVKKTDVPAHWDFDPQEGSEKGLVLSLPNGKLQLEKGDILVAFAQDGSRRYWGPYVVGETPQPSWNARIKEWSLVLGQ